MSKFLPLEKWEFVHILGEGAFGTVKLIIHRETKEMAAVKMIDWQKHLENTEQIRKEITIHKGLVHANIVKYLDEQVVEGEHRLIFLEYASGGELFDRIEPDTGLDILDARRYFRDLIAGTKYLHAKGIAHRDIKPENLLIDANNRLQISDFGMATVFRIRDFERKLHNKCGTLPYIAPEIITEAEFDAAPCDIWSIGVTLIAMLTGELPWDKPSARESEEYSVWEKRLASQYEQQHPWKKLSAAALSLVRAILEPEIRKRFKFEDIEAHEWFRDQNDGGGDGEPSAAQSAKRQKRIAFDTDTLAERGSTGTRSVLEEVKENLPTIQSQPVSRESSGCPSVVDVTRKTPYSFSQPTQSDNLLIGGVQKLAPAGSSISVTEKLFETVIRRMTRLMIPIATKNVLDTFTKCLDQFGYTWNMDAAQNLNVSVMGRNKAQLVFKVIFVKMNENILIDFRLTKGCGLDFKRNFLKIKDVLVFEQD